jgi:hypothetical protein
MALRMSTTCGAGLRPGPTAASKWRDRKFKSLKSRGFPKIVVIPVQLSYKYWFVC